MISDFRPPVLRGVATTVRATPGTLLWPCLTLLLALGHPSGERGFQHIADKFDTLEGHGPTCVRRFVADTQALGDRTPEQRQQDAFGQVDALLRAMALRG